MRPNLLIGEIFTNAARSVPSKTAVALGARSITFGSLDRLSNQLARNLSSIGITKGKRVAACCSTTVEVVPLFAALAKLGALFIPVNARLEAEEARSILAVASPDLVFVDEPHRSHSEVFDEETRVLESFLEDSDGFDAGSLSSDDALSGSDPHAVFFTSGSTGAPKGAVLSHETNYLRSHPGALLEPRGPMVCPYPLFHMGAWTIALQQWQARDTVVMLESADAGSICEAVARHRATRLNCIPAVWHRIIDELEKTGRHELDTVRFADSGTSATPIDLLEHIERMLPDAHIRVFYGSTEAGNVSSLDHADIGRKPGSCGVPAPGVSIRIDTNSELWVKTTTLFDGYLDDPGATREVLDGDWYRTGDLAEVDGDGFLTIVGRARDVIRTGGESVSPTEVESVLSEHSSIADIAVVGVPDPSWGEVICAVVVAAAPGSGPSLEELRTHCEGRLAPYKHPRRMLIVDSIPRTSSTAQVQRRLLTEQVSRT
jgi:fatty-acyl-CoA synthase